MKAFTNTYLLVALVDGAASTCDLDDEKFWFENQVWILEQIYQSVFNEPFTIYKAELESLLVDTADCSTVAKMSNVIERARYPGFWWKQPHQLVGRIDFELLQIGVDFGERLGSHDSYTSRSIEISRHMNEFPQNTKEFHNIEPEQLEMMVRLTGKARTVVDELTLATGVDAEPVFVPFLMLKKLASGSIETSWSLLTRVEELLESGIEVEKSMERIRNLKRMPEMESLLKDNIPLLVQSELKGISARPVDLLDQWLRTHIKDWNQCHALMKTAIVDRRLSDEAIAEWEETCLFSTGDLDDKTGSTDGGEGENDVHAIRPALLRLNSVLMNPLQDTPWFQEAVKVAIEQSALSDVVMQVLTRDIVHEQASRSSGWGIAVVDILAARGVNVLGGLDGIRFAWLKDIVETWNRALLPSSSGSSRLLDTIFAMEDDDMHEMKLFSDQFRADFASFKRFSNVYSAFIGYSPAQVIRIQAGDGASALIESARLLQSRIQENTSGATFQPLSDHEMELLKTALQRRVETINIVRRSNIIVVI